MPAAELPVETLPDDPMGNFVPADVVREMEAACSDASGFLSVMQRNEQTRRCWWAYKHHSGRKVTQPGYDARPYNGAADHEVYLTQAVLNKRNAMRLTALTNGALSVTPTESGDTASAAQMKTVLRWFMGGPMRGEVMTQAVRAGAYADRYRFSLLYVGWKEERGVEPVKLTVEQIAGWMMEAELQQMTQDADGMQEQTAPPDYHFAMVLDPSNALAVAEMVLRNTPSLAMRGKEGMKQALKAVKELQAGAVEATAYGAYVKRSSPCWEALEPFVDVVLPAETWAEMDLESCRWIGRVRWRSAQWIKEQAAIHGWNKKWVKEVLENHKGRSRNFSRVLQSSWALGGGAVSWSSRPTTEAQDHLYQIIELWDRSLTPDGLTGTYHTIMHADVPGMVGKRELRADWDGMYPFVPFTFSMDEKLLLSGLSVPEVTKTTQHAVKAQYDSRTDAAALTTYPTWTGDPELSGVRISPGKFIPMNRSGKLPETLQIPPPDGRSIEIERSLRASMDEFFGFAGPAVPPAMAMAQAQAMIDWFMASVSHAVARTARLIQQYMPPLKGARISGSSDVVTATAEDVRGAFDYTITYNVKSMDVEWVKEHLGMIKELVMPLDNRGYVNTLPILESAFNMVDPNLAARSLPQDAQTMERKTEDDARRDISQIFTGSTLPKINAGMNFAGLAEAARAEVMNSPARMDAVVGGSQIHQVLTAYMNGLVNNTQQHGGENAQTGRTLQTDPLQPKSEAEQFVETLETLPDGVTLSRWAKYRQQAVPMGQEPDAMNV